MQNHHNENLRAKIIELKQQGKSQQEIADALGVGKITVYRYLQRVHLTKRGCRMAAEFCSCSTPRHD
jgi:transposase